MLAAELNHPKLLELQPEAGRIQFAGRRAILLDVQAMGLLRRYLVDNLGYAAARTMLTQLGFAHGHRMAEMAKIDVSMRNDVERMMAGPRMLELQGLFHIEPNGHELLSETGMTVLGSFEAEEQVAQFGRAASPSCWWTGGVLSGYLTASSELSLCVIEDRCVSMGHAACHLTARPKELWGPAHAETLRSYDDTPLVELLDDTLKSVTQRLKATEQNLDARRRALVSVVSELDEPTGMVARSPAMRSLIDLAQRVAKVDATVLITGESGTGKERVARLVHDESVRAAGPFIAVNCGAITETLLESELFGHSRGSFTGASQDRPGLFEAANGGTLLLDEVGEVSAAMQVKLLRVLQEREIRRVGENRSRPIDVRLVAATNRDLAHGVAGGAFRQDLYYRLKVVELHLPALRDRPTDILPLGRVLLEKAAARMKRSLAGFSPEAGEQMLHYAWPGNVRELENAMERAVALAQGDRVEVDDLPEELRGNAPAQLTEGPVRPLEDIEKDHILAALERNGGNQTHTAQQLKIGSATLYRKLKAYGLIGNKRGAPKS